MEDFKSQFNTNADTKKADFGPTIKTVNIRKKKRQSRTLTGEWPDEKTRKLISMVKQRSELWDSSSPHHRSPHPKVFRLLILS